MQNQNLINMINYVKLVLILFALIMNSCVDKNIKQTSSTIEESKEKEVFIQEYKAINNPLINNDSVKMVITSAWVEFSWYYDDKWGKKIRHGNGKYLRVKLKDSIPQGYNRTWLIGLHQRPYLRSAGKKDLISDLKNYKQNDTLIYYARTRNYLNEAKYDTIAKIEFVPLK